MTALPRSLFAALLLGLALSTSAQASTLRCGTQLINEGDKMDAVLEKCGAPAKREVFPPAPPPGFVHHYNFDLYALDIKLPLETNATRDEIQKAMEGHVIGKAVLQTSFKR